MASNRLTAVTRNPIERAPTPFPRPQPPKADCTVFFPTTSTPEPMLKNLGQKLIRNLNFGVSFSPHLDLLISIGMAVAKVAILVYVSVL